MCVYIDICVYRVSGICPAPAPEGPERGDGRYVIVCVARAMMCMITFGCVWCVWMCMKSYVCL